MRVERHSSIPVGKRKTHLRGASYQKVLDARKHPVRGLWQRNGRYYSRLAVADPATGTKEVRRAPLESATTDAGGG